MTFDGIATAAKAEREIACRLGHTMDREAARGSDRDLRVTWRCAGCGERLIAIAQYDGRDWKVTVDGFATTRRCTAG